MALICENVTCRRGGHVVFKQLSFCLPESGFLLVKGGNGSGKTTLIQTLAGIQKPDEGRVLWNGATVALNRQFQKDLTYIGDDNTLNPRWSVEKHLRRWARERNAEAMLPGAFKFFDLEEKRNMRVRELSAGWKRRVALSKLLLSPGKLWLLDEPTNFLDPDMITLIISLIETRVKLGGVVVAASHTIHSAFPAHELELRDFCPIPANSKT